MNYDVDTAQFLQLIIQDPFCQLPHVSTVQSLYFLSITIIYKRIFKMHFSFLQHLSTPCLAWCGVKKFLPRNYGALAAVLFFHYLQCTWESISCTYTFSDSQDFLGVESRDSILPLDPVSDGDSASKPESHILECKSRILGNFNVSWGGLWLYKICTPDLIYFHRPCNFLMYSLSTSETERQKEK